MKRSIVATSSLTLPKLPRRTCWRVRMPNQVSTWFIQEALVGVKWKGTRGWRASQRLDVGGRVGGDVVEHDVQLALGVRPARAAA